MQVQWPGPSTGTAAGEWCVKTVFKTAASSGNTNHLPVMPPGHSAESINSTVDAITGAIITDQQLSTKNILIEHDDHLPGNMLRTASVNGDGTTYDSTDASLDVNNPCERAQEYYAHRIRERKTDELWSTWVSANAYDSPTYSPYYNTTKQIAAKTFLNASSKTRNRIMHKWREIDNRIERDADDIPIDSALQRYPHVTHTMMVGVSQSRDQFWDTELERQDWYRNPDIVREQYKTVNLVEQCENSKTASTTEHPAVLPNGPTRMTRLLRIVNFLLLRGVATASRYVMYFSFAYLS